MTQSLVAELARNAFIVGLTVAGPVLLLSMVIGVLVSIFQAVTQIQELTLSFVPKVLGVALAMAVFGPWMLETMIGYTAALLSSLPSLAR